MRRLAVQGVTRIKQVAQAAERVIYLQQRPYRITAHSAKHVFGGRPQVKHMTSLTQMAPIGFSQDSAASCGDHALMGLGQVVQHLLLNIAKTVFSFAGKKLPDRAAQTLFDHMVRVDKGHTQPTRQLPADGGFARAGKAHEDDAQGSLTLKISARPQTKMAHSSMLSSVFDPPGSCRPQGGSVAGPSAITRGVRKINNSLLRRVWSRFLNNQPKPGTSPSPGTLASSWRLVSS